MFWGKTDKNNKTKLEKKTNEKSKIIIILNYNCDYDCLSVYHYHNKFLILFINITTLKKNKNKKEEEKQHRPQDGLEREATPSMNKQSSQKGTSFEFEVDPRIEPIKLDLVSVFVAVLSNPILLLIF